MAKKQNTQRIVKNLPDACIPANADFTGDIGTMGGVRVDGCLKGKIDAGGNVTVGVDGRVEGIITAIDVNIAGIIEGNIAAEGTVQMLSGAKLVGDMAASSFAIEKGAYFKGQCTISDAEQAPNNAHTKAVSQAPPVQPEKTAVPQEPVTKTPKNKKTDKKD